MLHVVGLLAWGVVTFSIPFCAVIADLHSWCLNLAHSSPALQLTCHCYFYNPLADQEVCHDPLRPARAKPEASPAEISWLQ